MLAIPDAPPEHRPRAEIRSVARQIRLLAHAETHPVADELLDPRGYAEEVLKDRGESVSVPNVSDERARVK